MHDRRLLALGITALVACSAPSPSEGKGSRGSALGDPTAPVDATKALNVGDAAVTEARKWVGTHETGDNCNPFSEALGRPCEAWCADFVQYVWDQSGMKTDSVTAYAGSFLTYGDENGTFKSVDSTDVKPGDAIVWANTATDAAHVGMVSEVLDDGTLKVINGNYADDVEETVTERSSQVSGYGIAGFVPPIAKDAKDANGTEVASLGSPPGSP